MDKPIITVENLGKAYRLGQREEKYPTFREALVGSAKAPLKRLRQLSGRCEEHEMFWALRDVSFQINRGQVVGVIGSNGAGKSTLLKLLSRITKPTSGRAVLRGRVASLLEVGTGFHPELTGRENVYLNGSILGMKKIEIDRKFDDIVAFAEVKKFLDTPVKRYSSGMYVRLAFSVAAHLEPEILIVDEVLAVGDAKFQEKCLGKMHEVSEGSGRTVLFVSHNMSAVRRLCGQCIVLKDGGIEFCGSTNEAVDTYLASSSSNAAKAEVVFDAPPEEDPRLRIVGARVTDVANNLKYRFLSGEDLLLHVSTRNGCIQDQAELFASISDDAGRLVTTMNSRLTQPYQTIDAGTSTWTCGVQDLHLTEGVYYISLTAKNQLRATDTQESCLAFEVEGTNNERLAKNPAKRFGVVLPPHEWNIHHTPL